MPISEEEMAKLGMIIASGNHSGVVTFDEFRQKVPGMVQLDAADLVPSLARPGEPMWHQIFRNIKSHSGDIGNAIYDGRLRHVPDIGYEITPHGKAWLAANP